MKCEICATLQKLNLWNTEAAHYFQCTCEVTTPKLVPIARADTCKLELAPTCRAA